MVARTRFPRSDKTHGSSARAERNQAQRRPSDPLAALKRAWRTVGKRVPEMRTDLSCYAAVQVDRARLAASQLVTRVVCGMLFVVAVAAVFATASSLVIVGTAGGVASALGGNVWLANLITGTGALVLLFVAIGVVVRVRATRRRRRLLHRYRHHEARQRAMEQAGVPEGEQPC